MRGDSQLRLHPVISQAFKKIYDRLSSLRSIACDSSGTNQPPAADCVVHPLSLTVGEMSFMMNAMHPAIASIITAQGIDGSTAGTVTEEQVREILATISGRISTHSGLYFRLILWAYRR